MLIATSNRLLSMGNLKLALFLAYKSIIRGSRWTLVLVVLVMSLSFANLVLIPSILSGVTEAIDHQQISTLFGNIIIDPPPDKYYLDNVSRIENQVTQIEGVSGVSSHLVSQAFFEYNWQRTTNQEKGISGHWNVVGLDPQKEVGVTTVHESLLAGSYLGPDDRDQIVLGVEISGGPQADNQSFLTLGGIQVGDKIKLTFPNNYQREYTVKGIFKVRQEEVNRTAYITIKEMRSVLNLTAGTDRANQILVRVQDNSEEDRILSEIQGLKIKGEVRRWADYGAGVGGMVSSFEIITSLIGAIGLVVAGVVMFIVVYINVSNRKRQIGIMRAIGINRKVVMTSYMVQALLYASLGIIFGGILLGYVVKPYFDHNPIDLPLGLVTISIEMSTVRNGILGLFGAALLAGTIPVFNITRESIIKAIWGN